MNKVLLTTRVLPVLSTIHSGEQEEKVPVPVALGIPTQKVRVWVVSGGSPPINSTGDSGGIFEPGNHKQHSTVHSNSYILFMIVEQMLSLMGLRDEGEYGNRHTIHNYYSLQKVKRSDRFG